jgi:hypothetical protein
MGDAFGGMPRGCNKGDGMGDIEPGLYDGMLSIRGSNMEDGSVGAQNSYFTKSKDIASSAVLSSSDPLFTDC